MTIETIDLNFQNTPKTIASFLIKGPGGYVLVESGPASTFSTLEAALHKRGIAFSEIAGVLITHIHLDHSGGAWCLAEKGVDVYAHPLGVPHLVNPEKLIESATRIYGNDMEKLWTAIEHISPSKVKPVEDEQELNLAGLKVKCIHTPGHASHHVVYMVDGAYVAGDLCGVKVVENGIVTIPAPPPEVHVELWIDSIERMRSMKADEMYLPHFGKIPGADLEEHYNETEIALNDLKSWIGKMRHEIDDEQALIKLYEKRVEDSIRKHGGDDELVKRYFVANPPFMSVSGFKRYFKKHIDKASN